MIVLITQSILLFFKI